MYQECDPEEGYRPRSVPIPLEPQGHLQPMVRVMCMHNSYAYKYHLPKYKVFLFTKIVAIPICLAIFKFPPMSSRKTASLAATPSRSRVMSKMALSGFLSFSTHDSTTYECVCVCVCVCECVYERECMYVGVCRCGMGKHLVQGRHY